MPIGSWTATELMVHTLHYMRVLCHELQVQFQSRGVATTALEGLSFESREGEFLSIVGPSGCGKTTLLRSIAGIIHPTRGRIEFAPPLPDGASRGLLVFQENSLFPWMTVLENVSFGMKMLGIPTQQRHLAALEMLSRHGLAGREHAYPSQISTGMKQRVAVMRAFLSDPSLLLMDEPFAALDSQTRRGMQTELLELWQRDKRPVIFVTHDVDEAIYLSDRILVLTGQPAKVVQDIPVPFPRETREDALLSEEALYLKRQIIAGLKTVEEYAR